MRLDVHRVRQTELFGAQIDLLAVERSLCGVYTGCREALIMLYTLSIAGLSFTI